MVTTSPTAVNITFCQRTGLMIQPRAFAHAETVQKANIEGDRKTLKTDSAIPATMALIYLGLLLYFRSIGGYKAVHIDGGATKEGA